MYVFIIAMYQAQNSLLINKTAPIQCLQPAMCNSFYFEIQKNDHIEQLTKNRLN